jgi:hypothetical protein
MRARFIVKNPWAATIPAHRLALKRRVFRDPREVALAHDFLMKKGA